MNENEFREALGAGLGRAMIYARDHDMRPFREVILDACLHCHANDPQCEGNRVGFMLDACAPHWQLGILGFVCGLMAILGRIEREIFQGTQGLLGQPFPIQLRAERVLVPTADAGIRWLCRWFTRPRVERCAFERSNSE